MCSEKIKVLSPPVPENRRLYVGKENPHREAFPPNVVRNTKYSILTFFPIALKEQFAYFLNVYFLVVALTQFFPILQVGLLFAYVAPLVFVLVVSLTKEGYDDIIRYRRDKEANSEKFHILVKGKGGNAEEREVESREIKVGDILQLNKNQRIPADCVLLKTSEKTGASFVRTDQL
eukprot:gene16262-4947_t